MATYTWTSDAPTGVYKNHFISNKLYEWAALRFVIAQFAADVGGYGKKMGETVNLFHYDQPDIPADPTLTETTAIPVRTLTMGSHSITVEELGQGIEVTSLAETLSKFSPQTFAQKALAEELKHVMDVRAATALKTAKVCAIGTGASAVTWDTDGTPSSAATVNLTKAHMGIIRDYMVNDLHVPYYEGDHYIGLFTTKALRGLKDDNDLDEWFKYLAEGDVLYKSEIGRVESIRLIEVNLENALSNSIGTGNVTGEGIIFGDEALARAEALAPHLRAQPNYNNDFGRRWAVAWYGIQAYGLFWNTANDREARVVRWTSS